MSDAASGGMTPPHDSWRRPEDPVTITADDSIGTDIKQCPDCAETVRFEARVCRFCGHEFWKLPGAQTETAARATPGRPLGASSHASAPRRKNASGTAVVGYILAVMLPVLGLVVAGWLLIRHGLGVAAVSLIVIAVAAAVLYGTSSNGG
jgi:hypothetical protein